MNLHLYDEQDTDTHADKYTNLVWSWDLYSVLVIYFLLYCFPVVSRCT